jgi:hypothetical protein
VCTEGEQMEECDDTASTSDETPSYNVDSHVDLNYSINDDSYPHSPDNNSSSLHEANVTALNETQNEDFTVGRENRKLNAEEREPFNLYEKEMKPNYYEMQTTHTESL